MIIDIKEAPAMTLQQIADALGMKVWRIAKVLAKAESKVAKTLLMEAEDREAS